MHSLWTSLWVYENCSSIFTERKALILEPQPKTITTLLKMCKVIRIIDGACDHYPRYSLSRSCLHGWSYNDNKCRGNKYEVVNSITLEHPFCPQCEREQEDSIRQRYAGIEREIVKQGSKDNWLKEDVEVALEVCRMECKLRLAERSIQDTTSGAATDIEYSQTSDYNSDDQEARCSERAAGGDQSAQGEGGDDLGMIVDAYLEEDRDGESVTDSIARLYA